MACVPVCLTVFRLIEGFCWSVEAEGCRKYLRAMPRLSQTRILPVNQFSTVLRLNLAFLRSECSSCALLQSVLCLVVQPQCTTAVHLVYPSHRNLCHISSSHIDGACQCGQISRRGYLLAVAGIVLSCNFFRVPGLHFCFHCWREQCRTTKEKNT